MDNILEASVCLKKKINQVDAFVVLFAFVLIKITDLKSYLSVHCRNMNIYSSSKCIPTEQ